MLFHEYITHPLFFIDHLTRDPQWSMHEMHYHKTYELYFLEAGEHSMMIDDCIFNVKPYDVTLFPANIMHKSHDTHGYTRTSLYFSEDFLDMYFTKHAKALLLQCFDHYKYTLSKETFKIVKKILLLLEKEDADAKDNHIFIYLSELLNIINDQPPVDTHQNNSQLNQKLSPILSYITQNYNNLSSIEEIAEKFYITKFHLCRIFKEATGLTLIQYINRVKVQNACALLENTSMSVTDIGYCCGFNSTMYFCKTFKQLMNMTPSEFRKR